MKTPFESRWLGRMAFDEVLVLQEDIVARKRADRSAKDELLLLEHEPVYTIGRTPDKSSLGETSQLPHPLFEINRGGQATYHGPGQLIGYPIFDLRRCGQDLHRYLRWIEELVIETLAIYEVAGKTRGGLTGVWIDNRASTNPAAATAPESGAEKKSEPVVHRKIASIGVGVRHWITMHGFALNVSGDLSPFDHITPCGIANIAMTSIEKETGQWFDVREVGRRAGEVALQTFEHLHSGGLIHTTRSPTRTPLI
ncbi:MAG: lipoyl(octanoyl) transferase [Verrucomicrobiota bacterium]|jgi:lipoyl(octanoyl) transferase